MARHRFDPEPRRRLHVRAHTADDDARVAATLLRNVAHRTVLAEEPRTSIHR